VRRLAVLSLHTSPLAQPGAGDGGGMNVYVRELSSALARAGIECDVYTRRWRSGLAPVVKVEAGFRVHHVDAGPAAIVEKDCLPDLVDEFTSGVLDVIASGYEPDLIHANYWLSGLSGHALKHKLELPLVSTFHTLARVKAEAAEHESLERAHAEADVIGCSDAILASSLDERAQLQRLYGAVPERVEIVPPGVDPVAFSPGDGAVARQALGLDGHRVLLFVGRIQPLKGLDVAVGALAALDDPNAVLVIVGGPSGPDGVAELARVRSLVADAGLASRPVARLLPRRRRLPRAQQSRVFRARRARGRRVRDPCRRRGGRRSADDCRARSHRLSRRGQRARRVRGVRRRDPRQSCPRRPDGFGRRRGRGALPLAGRRRPPAAHLRRPDREATRRVLVGRRRCCAC